MSAAEEFIAMPGFDGQTAGAIVYWRLTSAVDFEDLELAWRTRGLDAALLPAPPTRPAALKRTMQTFAHGALVRALKTEAEGFVLVEERYDERGRPTYKNGLEVSLDPDGSLRMDPYDPVQAAELARTFVHQLNTLTQQDVSSWVVGLVHAAHAVRLRDTGGIYFVPRDRLPGWRAQVEAIRAGTAVALFEIPAVHSREALGAVLDAMTREAEADVAALLEELNDGDLSARALRGRSRKLEDLERKLLEYDTLVGGGLEALRAQCGEVQARIAEAALAADGEEQE